MALSLSNDEEEYDSEQDQVSPRQTRQSYSSEIKTQGCLAGITLEVGEGFAPEQLLIACTRAFRSVVLGSPQCNW